MTYTVEADEAAIVWSPSKGFCGILPDERPPEENVPVEIIRMFAFLHLVLSDDAFCAMLDKHFEETKT